MITPEERKQLELAFGVHGTWLADHGQEVGKDGGHEARQIMDAYLMWRGLTADWLACNLVIKSIDEYCRSKGCPIPT